MTPAGGASPEGGRLLTPAFVALGVADLAYFTAIGVAIFALPLFATGPVGADEAGAGLAFGAFALTALVCRPFAGRLTDTWGRRPLLVGGAALVGAGMLLLPLTDALAVVVGIRLLQGVGEAAFFVASLAMLMDLAPPSRIGEATSYNSLGLYLGIAFGPPLGELLVGRGGFDGAWYGATVLTLLAAVLVLLLPEVPRDAAAPATPVRWLHRPAVPVAVGFGTSLVAAGGFLAFAALHADAVGLENPSVALFVYGTVVVACRILFARVPDRLPHLPLGAASLAAIAVGLLLAATWSTPTGLLTGVVVMAVGVTFSTPAFFAAIFATALPSQRGAASGTASVVIDLGLGLGPVLLGLVARDGGIPLALAVGAAVAMLGAAWTTALAATTRRRSVGAR